MYKGAGILFLKKEGDQNFVSLGKRSISPQKGYWSVPGGKLDCDDKGDFLECALRETREEYFHHAMAEFLKISNIQPKYQCKIVFPFLFEYHIFLIDITEIDVRIRHNWEFTEVNWFNAKQLPPKVHLGVKYALLRFKL